ncbi:DUF3658 domain-containing protein [Nocardia brasiliensis]|uniref:DUF3658 domain-containing protein n=1 Tax=Nocardia brasiliensis TaxID=37326 RepID=UPI001892D6AC|nr:DUF3658 domain-containing protein [Nocardia brasiliensis]MBF6544246.1 hypothetical protein [Nocardia brasiliensis]
MLSAIFEHSAAVTWKNFLDSWKLHFLSPPPNGSTVRSTWERLVQENETFRIVRDGDLVSAPSDHYDRALLEAAGADWTPIFRIIAPVMSVADAPF